MIKLKYGDIVRGVNLNGIVENSEMDGFREDFHVLHCLIRKYKPKRFVEIGTHLGRGVNIIYDAGKDYGIEVFSIDLPEEHSDRSEQYPHGHTIGELVGVPYTQILCDSVEFDYMSLGRLDGAFIDGEHDYHHVYIESKKLISSGVGLFIYHDADMPQVYHAIRDAFRGEPFELYRVTDTRIAYGRII